MPIHGAPHDEDVLPENAIQFGLLPGASRALSVAPTEGPLSIGATRGTGAIASGDATIPLGGAVEVNAFTGRGAPPFPPTPRPTVPSHILIPQIYHNPNHYEFAHNLGKLPESAPLAAEVQGNQLAYELRSDWRRPEAIEPGALIP